MLIASEATIREFVQALFPYAEEGTVIALRSFTHDEKDRAARVQGWPVVRGDMAVVIRAATDAATKSANADVPMVFCPPIATFRPTGRAREEDLANGVCISVEIDSGDTRAAKARLEHLLGPVTMAIASGGEWVNPETGEIFPKMHMHWRLSEPTTTPAEHRRLKHARDLAMMLVGADPSAVSLVHPLRWPGSWHRKADPKMSTIAVGNPAAEVHLDDVITKLEEAVEAAGIELSRQTEDRIPGPPQASIVRLRSAVMAIPNADLHWDDWVKKGLLIHRATGGSDEGLSLWMDWSAKSSKFVASECEERWTHFHTHQLTRAGAGTLFYQAKANGWTFEEEPPRQDHLNDEGYWATVEAENAMTSAEWEELKLREEGRTIPASPEAKAAAGKELLWAIQEPWDEAAIPPRPWIARGYLMRGAVTVVSGPGSAGKSSLMVAWATALSVGCSFGRFKISGKFRVATYNVEDDAQEQKRRFSAMTARLGLTPNSLQGNLAILGPGKVGTLLHIPRDGRAVLNTPVMDQLLSFIETFQPDVLILDPFVELHGAEENDNTAVRAVMAAFRTIAAEYQMSVVILHHARKGAGTPGDPDSLRGASSIVGAARVAVTLNVMTEEEAKLFGMPVHLRRDFFRLDGAKSNYAPIGEAEWFERQERTLKNGGDMPFGDGVAVAWPWTPPNLLKQTPPADLDRVLRTIEEGYEDGVPFSATKRGNSSKRWAGKVVTDLLQCTEEQAREIVGKWLRSGLLYEISFKDPSTRHDAKGVRVDFTKRQSAGFERGEDE